jgi:hypothetical protein
MFYKSSVPETTKLESEKIIPSQFMRHHRPENYSDSGDQTTYTLDEALLSHRLETITERNETHSFEVFCRRLCERAICPNLRPQTGPEGGGDSKADSETFPVTDHVSRTWYFGDEAAAKERWAFAFSAKSKWADKVRQDVKGIVETNRGYARIICVTSRPARSKDRAKLEDDLTQLYGIPVFIHDRSWIIQQILEQDRKDLAFNYLQVGHTSNDPLALGPADYSRSRQLAAIEQSLNDPTAFAGIERQSVTECLVAAKLSRQLERPRIETDGRFDRAIRLADKHGSFRQQLEARYEKIWTAYWWFDDVEFFLSSFDEFADFVTPSEHAQNLELLCNLTQLLFNVVIHRLADEGAVQLDARVARVIDALNAAAAIDERPNNKLEAETSLLIIEVNLAMVEGRDNDLAAIWLKFSAVLKRARGMGEFAADRLISIIKVFGQVAGKDAVYNQLVEELAEFVSERSSEAEGGLILLERAQQLDFDSNFDMIRLLGRAAPKLAKREHNESLIEALQLLTLAYRSAGLLWAARSTCLSACAAIIVESELDSEIRIDLIPTLKIWAWIAIELRHIPDFLQAVVLLNGSLSALPLSEETKEKVREDLSDLDFAFASIAASFPPAELDALETLPDLLLGLELFMSRTTLMYVLGYELDLRADGSIPEDQSSDHFREVVSQLVNRSLAKLPARPSITNEGGSEVFVADLMGMRVEFVHDGADDAILLAEVALAVLEVILTTAPEFRVMPHTDHVSISLKFVSGSKKPSLTFDKAKMCGVLQWPQSLVITNHRNQHKIAGELTVIAAEIIGTTCMVGNGTEGLMRLLDDGVVIERAMMSATVSNSHSRFLGQRILRLSDWNDKTEQRYPLLPDRPALAIQPTGVATSEDDDEDETLSRLGEVKDHRKFMVKSVINVHLWDEACWRGTAYLSYGPASPPAIGLMFENRGAAISIFENWKARFGAVDALDDIYFAIIRAVSESRPHDYIALVTSRIDDTEHAKSCKVMSIASRSTTMTPAFSENLDRFLREYETTQCYDLMPLVLRGNNQPEILGEHAIRKTRLSVKNADDISDNDVEHMALGIRQIEA